MKNGGQGIYVTEFPGYNLIGPVNINILSGENTIFDTTIMLQAVFPKKPTVAISPDSTLRIKFDESSIYYQSYVFPSNAVREATAFGPDIVYSIEPANMLFDSPIKFEFDTVKLGLTDAKFGVYGASGNGKGWSFISKINGTKLEASGIGLGRIAILQDDAPPTISSISPNGSIMSRTPLLFCAISDNLSGLALDNSLSMKVDGRWVPAEFDIDSGKFAYRVKHGLKPGKHEIEVRVSDNQGNSTVKKGFFTVINKSQ
jgi:hypothetical protein